MKEVSKIGKYSYYAEPLNILTFGNNKGGQYVEIGKFTSISLGCTILLNHGDHEYEHGALGVFPSSIFRQSKRRKQNPSNGNVIIGNDVWIGTNVTIMSGVTIGHGSVIAANSHVIKSVEPYTVYGGNPAKFIKLRFDQSIVDKFLEIQWWNYSDSAINKVLPYLQQAPTLETTNTIKSILENEKLDTSDESCRWHEIQKAHQQIVKKSASGDEMWRYYLSNKSIDQLIEQFELIKKSS